MENLQIYLLGFAAQSLFGTRLVIQWWLSEKSRSVVSPVVFWYLSLGGSFLFLWYGILRSDVVIISGQLISYYIYLRNVHLKKAWSPLPIFLKLFLLLAPGLGMFFLSEIDYQTVFDPSLLFHPIILIGSIGQLALNLRFVYQWYHSEKFNTSLLPYGFWFISTWASVMVIIYSLFHPIYGIEPVLLISQAFGLIPYIRNMRLARKPKRIAV